MEGKGTVFDELQILISCGCAIAYHCVYNVHVHLYNMRVCIYVCVLRVPVCICLCMYLCTCMCMCVYVCMCVWVCGWVGVYIYVLHTHVCVQFTAIQVVRKLQTDPQYVQPPPNGCPSDIYKLMVLCW